MIGQRLGHYRIVAKIGAGGMGQVFRAYDEHLDRDVALKILPLATLADEARRKLFRIEALALAKLNHPNIETVFEFGTQNGVDFLAMELIAGVPLSDRLKHGPLPEEEIVRLGAQFAKGLAAAHEQGVLHRDLKPSNLMVTPDGLIKILDFGLAKFVNPSLGEDLTETVTTETGTIRGTIPYMSPEQLRGEQTDARSDIYSAGAVLYEMATGRRPFPETQGPQLIDAILHQAPAAPRSLNDHLKTRLESVILQALSKDASRRYRSARELLDALEGVVGRPVSAAKRVRWPIAGVTIVVATLALCGWFYSAHKAHALRETDAIVLAEFGNFTGDAVFDDTLKQALAAELQQSPFMNVLSDRTVSDTLKLMGRSAGERLDEKTALDLCQRSGSKAVLMGSIATLGSQYVILLNAINCQTGASLDREEAQATRKEEVLNALDRAAAKLREKLGESLSTIQKFDTPLEQATTSSLEALKAYSLGQKALSEKGSTAAIPFFERAVELDPSFASADQALAAMYRNLNEPERAAAYLKRAVELSARLSERERLVILGSYFTDVTGEIWKGIQSYELLTQIYPRYAAAYGNLGVAYASLGQYEKAVQATRRALQLNPSRVVNYENLAVPYIALHQFNEARDIIAQALNRKLDDDGLHTNLYGLAFLKGDRAEMSEQVAWFEGKTGMEDEIWALESDTEAYAGRLEKARDLTRRAIDSSKRAQSLESAALWEANSAVREALMGNLESGRRQAAAALRLAPRSRNAEIMAALALARGRDTAKAQAMEQELATRFPLNTQMQSYWLPTIRAQIFLARRDTTRAIESLGTVAPYDMANTMFTENPSCMIPAYVRGEAYLAARKSTYAAAEFQKVLDHPGVVWNCPTGALARLGLAQAYALGVRFGPDAAAETTRAKARAAFQDFLALWKDADPDIPILKQAKADYAKLK
jgi:tetratricopeptide (TPR) repeat protein